MVYAKLWSTSLGTLEYPDLPVKHSTLSHLQHSPPWIFRTMPSGSIAPDDAIIVISSDEDDCKDEIKVEAGPEDPTDHAHVGRLGEYALQNGECPRPVNWLPHVCMPTDMFAVTQLNESHAAAASASEPPPTRVGISYNARLEAPNIQVKRKGSALRCSQCRSPDCPAHQIEGSSQPSLANGTQVGGLAGVSYSPKPEEVPTTTSSACSNRTDHSRCRRIV